MKDNFIPAMYKRIDASDTEGLLEYMTEDSIFKFANIPALEGKENIRQFLNAFFASIKALQHSELECWNTGDVWFAKGMVDYTRHNDTHLKVPFSVLLKMKSERIKGYHIYIDSSELYK
jgi:ketosteroid isomerase-like protein